MDVRNAANQLRFGMRTNLFQVSWPNSEIMHYLTEAVDFNLFHGLNSVEVEAFNVPALGSYAATIIETENFDVIDYLQALRPNPFSITLTVFNKKGDVVRTWTQRVRIHAVQSDSVFSWNDEEVMKYQVWLTREPYEDDIPEF